MALFLRVGVFAFALAGAVAPGAEVIEGRVTVVQGGRTSPLAKALVAVYGRDSSEVLTAGRSGADGTFLLTGPFTGNLVVRATKKGYDALSSGSEDGAIYLDCSGECGPVELVLSPGAVVAGVIADDLGEPAPGVNVNIVDERNRSAQRRPSARVQTDDRGMFRLSGIPPGSYEFRATAPFRGAADIRYEIDSVPVELAAGEELQLRLTLRRVEYSSYKVSGVVVGVDIDPEAGGRLIVQPVGSPSRGGRRGFVGSQATGVDPQGRFAFTALPLGEYMFRFAPSSRRGRSRRGRGGRGVTLGRVSISGDTTGLTLAPALEAVFSGRLEWAEEPGSRAALYLRSADGASNAIVSAALPDFAFQSEVIPGRYRLQNRARDAFVASFSVGGREYDAEDFEIPDDGLQDVVVVLSSEFAVVEGLVRAEAGVADAAKHYQVELRGPGPTRSTETDQNGRFRFEGLTPGDYRIAAWAGSEPTEQAWRPFPIDPGAQIELAITAEGTP